MQVVRTEIEWELGKALPGIRASIAWFRSGGRAQERRPRGRTRGRPTCPPRAPLDRTGPRPLTAHHALRPPAGLPSGTPNEVVPAGPGPTCIVARSAAGACLRLTAGHNEAMHRRGPLALAALALVAPWALASCSSSPGHQQAVRRTTTTTTAPPTTTSSSVTTTTKAEVAVPNVIGLKIDAARYILHAVGFGTVPLNTVCNKGTLVSQSVVAALSVPGHAPFYAVGATPLMPGDMRPKGSIVGITWSDCYPNGTSVPAVIGLKFLQATHDLHVVGLTWSCFSIDSDPTPPPRPPPRQLRPRRRLPRPPIPPRLPRPPIPRRPPRPNGRTSS